MHVYSEVFIEFSPSPALSAFVESYWFLTQSEDFLNEDGPVVFPSGNPNVVFNIGGKHELLNCQTGMVNANVAEPLVLGQKKSAVEIRLTSDKLEIVGVKFRPYGLAAFTQVPIYQLTECGAPIQQVFKKDFVDVNQLASDEPDKMQKITFLEKWLLSNMNTQPFRKASEEVFLRGFGVLQNHSVDVKIHQLISHLDISAKTFQNKFLDIVGLTPKTYLRIQRLNKAISLMQNSDLSLTQIAHESSFSDQAHFNKEFKKIGGISPGVFRRGFSVFS